MPDGPPLPEGATGLYAAMMIHRGVAMKDWKVAVDGLPGGMQAEATEYLSGIAARYRVIVKMARDCGCKNLEEFDEVKRLARRAGAPGAVAWCNAGRPDQWRSGVDTRSQGRYNQQRST